MDGITVVIPTYNRAGYLDRAVASVLAQTCNEWHLVIVDDASTDNTASILSRYQDDPRIEVITRRHNGGAALCMNTGLDAVTTPYLLHLDSDDWLDARCVEVLGAVVAGLPAPVGVVYGDFETWTETDGELARAWVTRCPLYRNNFEVLTRWGSACPRMYRVEALRAVGGWATDVLYGGRYVEDITTVARISARFGLCHVPEVLYNYRWHQANESRRIGIHREYMRWIISHLLQSWGGEYVPVFGERPGSETVPEVTLLSWRPRPPRIYSVYTGAVEAGEDGQVVYEYTVRGGTRSDCVSR